jgi:hypothetical protein
MRFFIDNWVIGNDIGVHMYGVLVELVQGSAQDPHSTACAEESAAAEGDTGEDDEECA